MRKNGAFDVIENISLLFIEVWLCYTKVYVQQVMQHKSDKGKAFAVVVD